MSVVMVVYFLDAASPCNERLAWHEGVIRCTVTTVLCASAAATSSTSRTLLNLCYTVFNASEDSQQSGNVEKSLRVWQKVHVLA